jgi:predicted transglutaminase-like cysteine proteinase
MKLSCVRVFAALSILSAGAAVPALAQQVAAIDRSLETAVRAPQFMRVFGSTQPPYGFVRFCEAHPKECENREYTDIRIQATPERLIELDRVNRQVNAEIEPATDLEIYGVTEHWTIPTRRGDCEDYALLKRKRLMAIGWPANALLMTVVRDEKNEGHAVLTARTSQGDFILDNKIESVKLWNQTGYHFVMRQSYIDPKVWVSLDPTDPATPASLAGFGANQ